MTPFALAPRSLLAPPRPGVGGRAVEARTVRAVDAGPRPGGGVPGRGLAEQIQAGPGEDPGPGGWSGGFANQAHWDPTRARDWRCWAQSGPTWSAHCGAEVKADDNLGLCPRHRRALLEGDPELDELAALGPPSPEPVLSAS